jgi:hypothetical protein
VTTDRSQRRMPSMVAVAALAVLPLLCASCGRQKKPTSQAPVGASVVCELFLSDGESSRAAYDVVRKLQSQYGHQLHLLCLPAMPADPAVAREMERYDVKVAPCAVLDGYWTIAHPTEEELRTAVARCLEKKSPGLSMEMLAGPIADRYSVTFEACNLASKLDFDGIVEVYVTENDRLIGHDTYDHVFRSLIHTEEKYHISGGKCQPPLLVSWPIPAGTDRTKLGALAVVYDSSHKLLDSLCSDSRCTRSSVCPGLH